VLAVLTVGAVVAAGAGTGLAIARSRGDAAGVRARSQGAALASQRRAAALSDRLAALAVSAIGTNPGLAQLLAVEATRVDNTPQARAALNPGSGRRCCRPSAVPSWQPTTAWSCLRR
jgi:hypothetical protein